MGINLLRRIMKNSLWITLPVAASLSAGCTSTTQVFKVTKNANVEASYVAVDADFGKYDRLMASGMGIYFPTNAAPSVEDQQRTRQIFRDAFYGELTDYQIVEGKGRTTLEIQPTIVDYRNAAGGEIPNIRRDLQDIAKPGALLFLMELKDSQSGKVLARAADSASAPMFSTSSSTLTDWGSVETAAARWAKLFREFLDENLGR
jgi:hypothetical protein